MALPRRPTQIGVNDENAVAEFGRLIRTSHQQSRDRSRIYPAARIYEINYIRQQIQHSLSTHATSEGQRAGESLTETETESEGGTGYYTPAESARCEEGRQPISEHSDDHDHDDFLALVHQLSTTVQLHPAILIAATANYDSEDSTIISTPSSHGSMDEDFLDEDEALAYNSRVDEYDAELAQAGGGGDEDEDMGGSHVEGGFGDSDGEAEEDDLDPDGAPSAPFNPIAMGLKEIGGLARFRVSSYKPGNGVEELVNDDTERYWQSDGIQPHRLTMTFVKRVEVRVLRFYVDYTQDESYTPTRINWFAGTSEHDLHAFGTSNLVNPSGWIDVPLLGAGGGEDGNSLMAWVVQMQIIENHQNGKDTHIRGVKVYGFDDQLRAAGATGVAGRDETREVFKVDEAKNAEENEKALKDHLRSVEFTKGFQDGDPSGTASSLNFMEDPIIR